MEYALAAIGALTLIAISGWLYAARQKKHIGELETENNGLKESLNARERQDKAGAAHDAVGDLNDDAQFLPKDDVR